MTREDLLAHLFREGREIFSEDGGWTNVVRFIYSFAIGAVRRDCDNFILTNQSVTYRKGQDVVHEWNWRVPASPTVLETLDQVLERDEILRGALSLQKSDNEQSVVITVVGLD
jgi:hypothetical protein